MKGIAVSDNNITKNDKRLNLRVSNEMLKHINKQCELKTTETTKWDASKYMRDLILKDMISGIQEEIIETTTIQLVENTINSNIIEEVIEEKVIKSSFTKQKQEVPETKINEPLSAIVESRFKKVYKKS